MEEALVRILTPRRSIDILRDVHVAKEQGKPYVVVFVGVNGVGKSTNLAKVSHVLFFHGNFTNLAKFKLNPLSSVVEFAFVCIYICMPCGHTDKMVLLLIR